MNDDLMTDAVESPSAADDNVNNPGTETQELDFSLDALASYAEKEGLVESAEVEEEVTEQEELVADDSDESDIEAEDTAEEAEEADPAEEEEFAGDIEVMSVTELFEQVNKIEINGKEYSQAQLKSILGQEESAGTKAREASAKLKEIETRESKIAQAEAAVQQKIQAAGASDQMTTMQAEARKLNAAIEVARQEGDMYEVAVAKDKLEILTKQYHQAKSKVDTARQQADLQQVQAAEKGLQERGLSYLLEDGPKAKAWLDHVSTKLTPAEIRMATLSPAVAAAFEAERLYESAKGKEGKKLVSKGPTLKASGKKAPSKNQKQQAKIERLNSGKASRDEIEAFLRQQGREMFS